MRELNVNLWILFFIPVVTAGFLLLSNESTYSGSNNYFGSRISGFAVHPLYPDFGTTDSRISLSSSVVSFIGLSDTKYLSLDITDDMVYRYAYISFDGLNWVQFNLTPIGVSVGDWNLHGSNSQLSLNPNNFRLTNNRKSTSDNYLIYYSCTRINNSGVLSWDCHDGWQIILFNATVTIPLIAVDTDLDGYNSTVDCNDNNANINPGKTDVCGNEIDEDCSGSDLNCPPVIVNNTNNSNIDLAGSFNYQSKDLLLSFKASQNLTQTGWNILSNASTGKTYNSLLHADGTSSNIMFVVTGGILSHRVFDIYGASTGSNSGVFPDNVLRGFWAIDESEVFTVKNLDPNYYYGFYFLPSRIDITESRITQMLIDNNSVNVESKTNINQVGIILNIKPSVNGNVIITFNRVNSYAYLNALVIRKLGMVPIVDTDSDGYNSTVDCNDNNNSLWILCTGYLDADSDTYTTGGSVPVCSGASLPSGYRLSSTTTDCNDNNKNVNPGKTEICGNGIDEDCNGSDLTCTTTNTTNTTTSCINGGTCSDGLLGCNEYGVDCGGVCNACSSLVTLGKGTQIEVTTTGIPRIPRYLIQLPKDYDSNKKYPIIIFLVGTGETVAGSKCADSVACFNKIRAQGLPKYLNDKVSIPFIVISPQPAYENYGSDAGIAIIKILDNVTNTYAVDTTRIYLTGLSLGGEWTNKFSYLYSEIFAGLVPIASGYATAPASSGLFSTVTICDAGQIPLWGFHNDGDATNKKNAILTVVNKRRSDCNISETRLTLYNQSGHGGWTETYTLSGMTKSLMPGSDPYNIEIYTWLLSKSRPELEGTTCFACIVDADRDGYKQSVDKNDHDPLVH